MARRTGRGRLSSIELLPPEAQPIVSWAKDELTRRERHQIDIHAEFNRHLAALGEKLGRQIGPISLSAFNRESLKLATWSRRREETRFIAQAIAAKRKPGEVDDVEVLAAEAIDMLIFEIIEGSEEGDIDATAAKELGQAARAVAGAKLDNIRRRKFEKDFAGKAEKAIDAVAKAKGLPADTVEAIKVKVLGVRPRVPA